jgi:hypothetical protein
VSQLFAKESEKKRKVGPTMGQKNVSQLWAKESEKRRKIGPTMGQKETEPTMG